MPTPEQASIINAGAELAGQTIGAIAQGRTNRKTRKWNEKMYALQRQHALEDWNRQNEYNSPMAQMQRLRDAKLNPNLVYGDGATHSAGAVRSSSVDAWNPRAPQFDFGDVSRAGLGAYYDVQLKEAQIDNLKATNTVTTQDALLRAAQVVATTAGIEKTAVDTARGKFDLELASELKQTSVEAAKASVQKTQADIKSTLDENERRAVMQAPNLLKAAEEVLTMRANRAVSKEQVRQIRQQLDNLKSDEVLKELDINLKKNGIQPSDPLYLRILGRILGNFIDLSDSTTVKPRMENKPD